ncbi:GNAT family N-acetyltransferase [Vibrio sp. TRT 2004]|uniref:GNAT family N-acetyltransferase n=1 Tax=Vibrio sp. TRT 2004 TaxID=3418506 RepID=UPI003CE95D1F
MIQLAPMKSSDLEQVMNLRIEKEQLPYVGTIEEILLNADDKVHPHLVWRQEKVVGIFLIDTTYGQNYDFSPSDAVGFRAFLIDSGSQGKGIGGKSMSKLAGYLSEQYPNFGAVYLTVNCKNTLAYQCYVNNGFKDSHQLYLGGAAGPQHIMFMPL